jgi:hypothetical protein
MFDTNWSGSASVAAGVVVGLSDFSPAPSFGSPTPAKKAVITVEGYPVRYFTSGGTPTVDEGLPVDEMDIITITGINDIKNFKVTAQSGTAVLFAEIGR